MSEKELIDLIKVLQTDQKTTKVARLGLCRVWTKEAIDIVRRLQHEENLEVTIEAREVTLGVELDHTFLRVLASESEPYIYDGVGTVKYPPYMGPESNAPHLATNSRLDYIHYLDVENRGMKNE